MDEVDDDVQVGLAALGLGVDGVELVAVAVDEHHPGPPVAGVPALGLV